MRVIKLNRAILIFSILMIVSLMLGSCCKNKPCVDFIDSEKDWMPYKENDSLYFYNSQDSSIIILGVRDYFEKQEQYKGKGMFSCYDGCMNIISVDIYTIKSDFSYRFTYLIEKTKIKGMKDEFFVEAGVSYGYGVSKDTKSNFDLFSLAFSKYNDSLIISGKTVKDVYEYSTPNKELRFQKMYVSRGIGIVKFELLNNQVFELSRNNRLMIK